MAGKSVSFVGRPSDSELLDLYQHCAVFLFPGEEDFGITPLEAMACGRPVIAYGKGGALETVVSEKTGAFFPHQCVDCLAAALYRLKGSDYNPATCRARAEEFSESIFRKNWSDYVQSTWIKHSQGIWEKDLIKT